MNTDRTNTSNTGPGRGFTGRGFTMVELLVVMSIFVLLLAVGVPAFSRILASTERSQAGNQVSVALSAARAAAVSSEGLSDTAAVFFYDPTVGRTRIGVYQAVGTLKDLDLGGTLVERDVFTPVGNYQPVQLPRGWMVRGFAPAGSFDTNNAGNGWYEKNTARELVTATGNWVFPETGFYDTEVRSDFAAAETTRQTFMVRFKAGTGTLSTSERAPAIVVDASPSIKFRTGNPFGVDSYRLDKAADVGAVVRRILATPSGVLSDQGKRDLLGDAATDSVLARPVAELAVYDEKNLASALGARGLNTKTNSLYGDSNGIPQSPKIDATLFPNTFRASPKELAQQINDWVQGTMPKDKAKNTVPSDARIVSVDRYLGVAQEIKP